MVTVIFREYVSSKVIAECKLPSFPRKGESVTINNDRGSEDFTVIHVIHQIDTHPPDSDCAAMRVIVQLGRL